MAKDIRTVVSETRTRSRRRRMVAPLRMIEGADVELLGTKWRQSNFGPPSPAAEYVYSVRINHLPSKPGRVVGYCDCNLIRKTAGTEDFKLNAWYYYRVISKENLTAAIAEQSERFVARTTIWAKFLDLSWLVVNQSGIDLPKLPSLPGSVEYRVVKRKVSAETSDS